MKPSNLSILQSSNPLTIKSLKIYFLGTNGWYDTELGSTICTYIKHPDYNIILDAGFGIHKLDRYCDFSKPSHLFLSHLHIDHICGLHLLAKFKFKKGLKIFLKKGLKNKLGRFLSADYTVPLNKLPYKAEIIELKKDIKLPFKVVFLSLVHSVPVLGYRFEIDGEIISYIMDTGYCENAVKLSKNADLLIAESSYLPGEENKDWPHLNPDLAVRLAKASGAKKLALTHFGADKYITKSKLFNTFT
ncbi:MAG: ribonuclease Z [Elusimicrobiota bacterium]